MQIDRVLFPIESLGPGKRLVIWTVGCTKHCYNCSNQELWEKNDDREISVEELVSHIKRSISGQDVEGITITGGDPMEQPTELNQLLEGLISISKDVLIYTGYTFEELNNEIETELLTSILRKTTVLIDGRYVDSLNDSSVVLRGSANQMVHYFDPTAQRKYEDYMLQGRRIQNVYSGNKVISVGIHNKEDQTNA